MSTTAKVADETTLGNMGHKHQPTLILKIKGACVRTQNSCLTGSSKVKAKHEVLQSLHSLYFISAQDIVL